MNRFRSYFIETYETIIPIVFAIDVSRSMAKHVQQIRELLQSFLSLISSDDVLNQRVDISIVMFSKEVDNVRYPVSAENFKIPFLQFSEKVATTNGIYAATDVLKSRIGCFKSHNIPYYCPRLFLFSNALFDEQSTSNLIHLRNHLCNYKNLFHLHFFPVCFSNNRKDILSSISIDIPPLNYLEMKFDQCFRTIDEDDDRGLNINELFDINLTKLIMAKNDFTAEAAENYEQKCLCVLVLDVSGSMYGKPIEELNKGLQEFYNEISSDETTSQRLEVSLITFNDSVKTVQEPALVENFTMPKLEATGSTAMVNAVNEAIDKVAARKQWYKSTGQAYYRPWIILMTDGEPDSDQDVDMLAQRIKQDTANKRYAFLPIGVEGAKMEILDKIKGNIPPMKLQGTKFSSFFKWLSASMGTVVTAEEGQQVDLSAGADDWMAAFTI